MITEENRQQPCAENTNPIKENHKTEVPSLGRRYSFKLLSNAAAIPLYLVMEAILPRSLGPAAYGAFSYATGMFQYFMNFIDAGTSTCLFTTLAKNQRDWSLLAFFWRVVILFLIIILLISGLCMLPSIATRIMPGVPPWIIPLAALWAYAFWGVRLLRGINDALGQTVKSEKARTIAGILACIALLFLHFSGILDLPVLFIHQLVYMFGMIIAFKIIILENWGGWRNWNPEDKKENASAENIPSNKKNTSLPCYSKIKKMLALSKEKQRIYIKNFLTYSLPIFLQSSIAGLALMGDRWLLQVINGNIEQAFFSISQKVGIACFLFISAMIPLLTRELSMAHGKKDLKAMANLLEKFAPILYAIAVYFSAFVSMESATVVAIFGGHEFAAAVLPVQIMALYPIHQGYGQLTQAVFYSSNKTKDLSKITTISCALGFGVSLIILLPSSVGGLNLGAVGLATKTVILQILVCNFTLFMCSRFIPIRIGRFFLHQLVCLIVLMFIAKVSNSAADLFPFIFSASPFGFNDLAGTWLGFFNRGILYTCLCLLLVFLWPWVWGLNRKDLKNIMNRIKNKTNRLNISGLHLY